MKLTQTWGWLAAGVLAAGLNASYHDGGLQWAHRVADRVEEATSMVRDLAAGRTDLFLTEARVFLAQNTAQTQTASCRWSTALARVQTRIARTQTEFARVETMTARQQEAMDRAEAQRDRIEAQRERWQAKLEADRARIEAKVAELRIPANLTPLAFDPPRPPCPRVRVNVPRVPMIRIPAPSIHIASPGADPI
jgi:hypothetical protein